jgi:hypothetical protein
MNFFEKEAEDGGCDEVVLVGSGSCWYLQKLRREPARE